MPQASLSSKTCKSSLNASSPSPGCSGARNAAAPPATRLSLGVNSPAVLGVNFYARLGRLDSGQACPFLRREHGVRSVRYAAAESWRPFNRPRRSSKRLLTLSYWQNDTFFIITDKPWSVPDVDHILIRTGPERAGWVTGNKAIKVLAIRGPGINAYVKEDQQLGTTVSLKEAMDLAEKAVDIPSPMLINHDDDFVSHYYHWIGETFLGAWRVWSNYKFSSGVSLPDFKTLSFRHMYDIGNTPPGLDYTWQWEDHAGANRWFMEKWFPGMTIEDRTAWDARAASGKLYRIELALLGDRWGGHRGPSSAGKPWGDVLRLPVDHNYLLELRDRALAGMPVSKKAVKRPRVKYLERQDTDRKLTDEAHQALIRALQMLDDEKLVDFSILHFDDGTSFESQIKHLAETDFLVSVHGNGLTHSLWLTPGKCKGVFEIQPEGCSLNDFSPLAIAAGVQHYLVDEVSICTPDECAARGCKDTSRGGVNRNDIDVDPKVIVKQIRSVILEHCLDGVV